MSLPRVSLRLQPRQLQVLTELSNVLNAPISVMIRAIVLDWLTRNEDIVEQIITGEREFDLDWNKIDDEENE